MDAALGRHLPRHRWNHVRKRIDHYWFHHAVPRHATRYLHAGWLCLRGAGWEPRNGNCDKRHLVAGRRRGSSRHAHRHLSRGRHSDMEHDWREGHADVARRRATRTGRAAGRATGAAHRPTSETPAEAVHTVSTSYGAPQAYGAPPSRRLPGRHPAALGSRLQNVSVPAGRMPALRSLACSLLIALPLAAQVVDRGIAVDFAATQHARPGEPG